ncbi:MAG: hypothetical protein EWV53_05680 [Microcystis panniformis Mp_MB_F_20051200_S9]|uniref:Uncharacterized protein n=1 Tax=Microcystis panniformis Mp_MB_F_20051200_S9 TaxID=2486223 RepID=A0A552Q6J0_9CHRO|nr:MAG: hypothetical protein EWV43_21355 [Microcystis panniformis Mp_MB_F_20080800_S26D]TRV47380.1 MAG: hypothetical protein EWV42_16510 [Microcystis panniformis Mp_GB_SS_20050300_S99D]TRV53944.1 MAG: hypothetical protein EWV87_01745 [Microcystis panniformis Mp_GB_SS_20050300_S99]TRV54327.1 MAG: hypothetical protein EWV69_22485 [Microcystis panniformis Mp_MB_F_20080800_S26]TRV64818.1 MAG: hypothetical protein EWV53_05680 [Microcystis panniformis Mp_MB_F_20051200_S9]TRV65871.1 MAG: hypothetical
MRNFAPIIPICRPKSRAFSQRESFYRIRLTRGSVAKSKEILKILLAQGEADRDRIVKSFFCRKLGRSDNYEPDHGHG